MTHAPAQEIQRIERILSLDPERHVAHLGFLHDNPITHCWIRGDAAMYRGISDHEWIYLAAQREPQLVELLALLDPTERYFAVLEDWMVPAVLQDRPVVWHLVGRRFVLPDTAALPPPHPAATPLDPSDADQVHHLSEYRDLAPADYIRRRIERGPSTGITLDGRLVAWGLTHDDGALGMIHVLPEARRRGLGAAILTTLAHLVCERGRLPYSHIEDDNAASVAIHLRAGFEAGETVRWLERGPRAPDAQSL